MEPYFTADEHEHGHKAGCFADQGGAGNTYGGHKDDGVPICIRPMVPYRMPLFKNFVQGILPMSIKWVNCPVKLSFLCRQTDLAKAGKAEQDGGFE